MKKFEVTVLGCRAAFPSSDEITSCFVVNFDERLLIIDCGEGAQMKMQQYGIKLGKLQAILISHLHGDHVYGLPGLLTSLSSHQRTEALTIIGPVGIKDYVEQNMLLSHAFLSFDIHYIQLSEPGKKQVWEDDTIYIQAFPLVHRVPTFGYVIAEKPGLKNINPAVIKELELTIAEIKSAKSGLDIIREDGEVVYNEVVVLPTAVERSFAYVSDTQYDESIARFIENVSTIYHEATYLDDLNEKAKDYMHSTSLEAAKVAMDAKAISLYLGHLSARYDFPNLIANEAKIIFPKTEVVYPGMRFEID